MPWQLVVGRAREHVGGAVGPEVFAALRSGRAVVESVMRSGLSQVSESTLLWNHEPSHPALTIPFSFENWMAAPMSVDRVSTGAGNSTTCENPNEAFHGCSPDLVVFWRCRSRSVCDPRLIVAFSSAVSRRCRMSSDCACAFTSWYSSACRTTDWADVHEVVGQTACTCVWRLSSRRYSLLPMPV